jgi:hypothetical protein
MVNDKGLRIDAVVEKSEWMAIGDNVCLLEIVNGGIVVELFLL